ncbi:hypothetical protein BGZ81_011071 [Podila clonocystis]|nr:hypothetical protein BGZ81_011071 [Podila clonocystis]
MGKLIPRCFAANSDTVYFLARAVRTNEKNGPELVALVKSDPYPVSIQEAKWTVVDNTDSRLFSYWYNRHYESGDLSCTVDDNGVFMFTGQYNNGARTSYRYDPLAPKDKNTTGGWTRLFTDSQYSSYIYPSSSSSSPDPFILFNVNGRNNTKNTNSNDTTLVPEGSNSTQFILLYKFGSSRSISSVPSIHYWSFNSSGYTQDSRQSNLVNYAVGKTTNNGTTLSVRYGSGKLWAVMETGDPYYGSLNNVNYPRYRRTLAVFPFTAPYTVTSPPTLVATTPWDLTCSYYDEIKTLAVFGGKIYYICRNGESSDKKGHMYTYDSAANQTLGPFETDEYCIGKRSLTLVPGKPGTVSPAYGLVSVTDSFGVLDLSPENYGRCTNHESDGRNLFRVDDMIEAPKPDPPECLETCTEMKAINALFGGIFGGIAVVLICCCLSIRRCQQKKRRKQALAAAAVVVTSEEVALDAIEEQPPPPYKRDPTE